MTVAASARTRHAAAILVVALTAVALLASASRAQAAQIECPATFHVLHDDRVGKLKLPAGQYDITVLNDRKMSCAAASDLFRQFLEDYDGNLPKPWVVRAKRSEFIQKGSDNGFKVALSSGGGGGGGGGGHHPASGTTCPSFFRVLHDDRIGKLKLPAGEYRITLLAAGRLTCERASQLFARFLQDFDGNLPGRWRLHVATATFSRNPHVGFRVKEAEGPPVNPGGGGKHPGKGSELCPGSFRVLHDDRIGRLRLPAGRYSITVTGLGCQNASKKFTSFLEDFEGNLPRPWKVNARKGLFTKGSSGKSFRVKLLG